MIAVGSSSGICSDSDDAGRRQSSQAWGHETTCFHTSGTVYAHLSEDDAQLCGLPTFHNAFCHDLMISYDLSVLVGMIYICIDITRLKAQMRPHVCFKPQLLPFSTKSQVQKCIAQ